MNDKIVVSKNDRNQVVFDYGEGIQQIIFNNLKDFSKKILELDNIQSYNPDITAESGLELYKDTILQIIDSLKNDTELLELYEENKRITD